MNILVCLSQVPDTTTKIAFSADNKSLNKTGVQYIINPYDELALTKALELNEATGGGTVTVIHVGGADAEPVLRKALAIGADQAVRVDAEPLDSRQVAAELATYIQGQSYDLVLTGRESIDYNSGLVVECYHNTWIGPWSMWQLPSIQLAKRGFWRSAGTWTVDAKKSKSRCRR